MRRKFALKKSWPAAVLGVAGVAGLAYAATQIIEFTIQEPIALSVGGNGDKPKLQRSGSGLLVTAYGDTAPEDKVAENLVYDTKADAERYARDVFVRTCDSAKVDCDVADNWSAPVNISQSVAKSSISTAWRGGDPVTARLRFAGDTDKANIKTSGPVMVVTWIGNYCPDGDLQTAGVQAPVQRAVRYLERDSRIIPFACTWMAYSKNSGATWSAPIQLSTGERDAKQDASGGNVINDPTNANYRKGQVIVSWQEDPRGLQLGEADGPGDGASGANVSNGTDVWYTWATVNLADSDPSNDVVLATPPVGDARMARAQGVRVTDNYVSDGIGGTDESNPVFGGDGLNVPKDTIESGQTGAARPNIGMVGTTTIIAYEETKGSLGLDEGKFIRYHSFAFNKPAPITGDANSNDLAGCIISDPLKNGRRVRFLTQGPTEAGPGGMQLAIFWKEGIYDKGGPSDIAVRRGMGGLKPANMVPAVDPACATSDYTTAIALTSARGENISSRASTVTAEDNGLGDDTERNFSENALAHRGVLRGNDLWIGYNYTADLVKLWAQLDNYNFWVRKFTWDGTTGSWGLPVNLSNVTDKTVNVREPRFFGTPQSSPTACPSGDPAAADTTNPTLCQDRNVIFVAWGTQTNVSPFDPVGPVDLGLYITVSNDAGATYATPVKLSTVQGPSSIDPDGESAYETQPVTRPDGREFYAVWNQANPTAGTTAAEYTSGTWALVDVPVPPPPPSDDDDGGSGCTMSNGKAPFDPTLLLLAGLGLAGVGLRRVRRN